MIRRTQDQWLTLFQAHEQSDLPASAFCKEHALNPNYFSLRKKQLLPNNNDAKPFIRVASAPGERSRSSRLILRGAYGELSITDVSPDWLASLLKQLS